jgi:acyl-CoA synthetase (AMP-forming)/AMP-acid ligase II
VELGYAAVHAGATLVFMDHFDPDESLQLIQSERITLLGQVPTMFFRQMQSPVFETIDWRSVKTIVWGGAGAPRYMVDKLVDIVRSTGAGLVTGYGSTELCGFVTYTMPYDGIDHLSQSIGKVVSPYEIVVVGPDRRPLPAGEIGELAFRGPVLMKGYLNAPAMTNEVIDDAGWYYTSDLGRMDADGYLYLSGRTSEMFKSGGENVFPREIEIVLESHPAVLFSAVIGVPDPIYGEIGHAFVMLKQGQKITTTDLQSYCREHLTNFKTPKHVTIRARLPLLASGKVDKMTLRDELRLRPDTA